VDGKGSSVVVYGLLVPDVGMDFTAASGASLMSFIAPVGPRRRQKGEVRVRSQGEVILLSGRSVLQFDQQGAHQHHFNGQAPNLTATRTNERTNEQLKAYLTATTLCHIWYYCTADTGLLSKTNRPRVESMLTTLLLVATC
jgi:hypothetical protein